MKLIFFILIVSCSHVSQKTVVGPDGSKHKLVSCIGVEKCYEKAAQLCGKYKIVNTSHDTNGIGNSPTTTTIKLLVKCDEQN